MQRNMQLIRDKFKWLEVQEKPLYGFKCREIQTKSQLKRFSNTDSRNMQIQQSRIFRVNSNKYAISQRSKTHIRDRKHFEKIFLGPKLGYNIPHLRVDHDCAPGQHGPCVPLSAPLVACWSICMTVHLGGMTVRVLQCCKTSFLCFLSVPKVYG
jgi:hypothetical protein